MAATVQQSPVPVCLPTADVVGHAFVHQYYLILHQSPELVYRFYQDVSKLGRPEVNGYMSITTTMQAINEKILSLDYAGIGAEITSVDSQDSYNGGVLVLVTGYLTGKDNIRRKFTQTFFLAPQDKGYFVLNDVFRYIEDANFLNRNEGLVHNLEAPVTAVEGLPVQNNHVMEKTALRDGVDGEGVYNPPETADGSTVEEQVPAPKVVDEAPKDAQLVVDSNSKTEEVPKKSYASILKVMNESSVSSNAPSPMRSVAKSHEQLVTVVPPSAPASEPTVPSSNVDNGSNPEVEADGYSIYIKGLPINAAVSLLENEFRKFGPIKKGGIQVRSQRGVCFGFVEFEAANAMQSAIEASPIIIGGRQAIIEPKKSTNRGHNRGRFSSGRGAGFRSEGGRGRGNYGGGRGYNRADYDNRNEYGNRINGQGGFLNHGGDGYQRADRMGNNGNRVNRAGGNGMNANGAARTTAPRVSARA